MSPGHTDLLQGKDQENFEKIIPEMLFLIPSLIFEGMDILECLMKNLLEPWCQEGYEDVIYGVSNHKKVYTKAYRWRKSWLIYIVLLMSCDC